MYKYEIKGGDFRKAKVRRVARTTAIMIDSDWIGADVIIVKEGDIEKFEKIHD